MNQDARDLLTLPEVRSIIEKMAPIPVNPDGAATNVEGLSDYVEELFRELGTEDIGELVAAAIDSGLLTQEQGGEILGIATWGGRTNGAQLQPTLERWLLDGTDTTRVGLALKQHTFPFSSLEQMSKVLSRIAGVYPQYAEVAHQLIAQRREQGV